MTTTRAPGNYVTPECREAEKPRWVGGHFHCPGPLEVRQSTGTVAVEVLKCACSYHPGRHGATP